MNQTPTSDAPIFPERQPASQCTVGVTSDENIVLDIPQLQENFAAIVGKTLLSLENRIPPQMLAETVLALGAYEPVKTSEVLLLEDHEEEIKCARSNSDIFGIIRPYMSFFNPEVLGTIIRVFGATDDQRAYNRYTQALEVFCNSTKIAVSTDNPCNLTDGSDEMLNKQEMIVKIRIDTNDRRLQRIRDIKSAIAKILGVDAKALQIVGASEGSLEVVFLVHSVVIKQLNRLNDIQKRQLQDLGVLNMEFHNQVIDLRVQHGKKVNLLVCNYTNSS